MNVSKPDGLTEKIYAALTPRELKEAERLRWWAEVVWGMVRNPYVPLLSLQRRSLRSKGD